ncbi:MAG: hypothetical protein M3N19_01885 [Candidatus Eremiobacteraeota bacterium]|nr:hypothetical protein [Candidatus Eremiobacteraeota bacterium]
MNRILSSFLTLAMVASLSVVATAREHKMGNHMGSHMGSMHGCTRSQMYVHGYMRGGKHVKGYCRAK